MPDKSFVLIETELFLAPECFFNPSIIGLSELSIVDNIGYALMVCPKDIRRNIFRKIVLAGGSSHLPGLKERITQDIQKLTNSDIQNLTTILIPSKYAAWQGALKLGNFLRSMEKKDQNVWLDYDIFHKLEGKIKYFYELNTNIINKIFEKTEDNFLSKNQDEAEELRVTNVYEKHRKRMYDLRLRRWRKEN